MDENKTIIDIKPYLDEKSEEKILQKNQSRFHSNPIFKKFLVINSKKENQKFSIKDLFR